MHCRCKQGTKTAVACERKLIYVMLMIGRGKFVINWLPKVGKTAITSILITITISGTASDCS
jgi:hypothetical protein